jgi:PGF-CTERM protein
MNAKIARVIVAAVVVASTAAVPVTAESDAQSSLTVALSEDGSAKVEVILTYDLTSENERDAFRSLENDADARDRVRTRFHDRMAGVAASAENATGREMRVEDATIDLRTTADDEIGIVELAVTWKGLAAVDDDRLVVTQPFSSGFEADRRVTVVAPDGYELADATPEPATVNDRNVTWKAGTSLDGFEVTLRPEAAGATASDDATTGGQSHDSGVASGGAPGFGVGTAVASLVAAVLLLRRE